MHKPFLDLSCHIRETETRTLKSVKSQFFGFIVMHLSAAIPEGDPGEPPVICTTTFTNSPSRGQRSVLFQVKKCNISKEFYTRTRKFSSEKYSSYVSNRWPAERNRIQEQEKYESRLPSFLSPFCQNVFTNIPSPFEGGNGTRYQFHLQNGGGATLPRVFPRRSCYESAKAIQSLHPGLKTNEQSWQILRDARICPRGYPPPPGWPLISAWHHYQGHIMTCTVIINNALPWRQNVDFLLIYSFVPASVLPLTRVCK